jgi:hypothetical protein
MNINEEHVARRLKELLSWADYIVESLTTDQNYEPGKKEILERVLGIVALKELRERAWALREKMYCVSVEAEVTARAAPVYSGVEIGGVRNRG